MKPGPALQVICPYCHGEKALSSLMSGNTFNAVNWSDTKTVCPMLLRNSPVQRCPHCGKFYFLSKARYRHPQDGPESMDTGELTFEQAVEALKQLYPMADSKQKFTLRLMVLYSFNDIIRYEEKPHLNDSQIAAFIENCREMIAMKETSQTLRAELYREIGEFEKCCEVLSEAEPCSLYERVVRSRILQWARERDARVRALPRFQGGDDEETGIQEQQAKGLFEKIANFISNLFI